MLGLDPLPTALFVIYDFAAIGAKRAIRNAGLQVGQNVAVVGFDDVPFAPELGGWRRWAVGFGSN
jgi:LacI family transcriptional regulator